jgi:hypothetical protein
MGSQEDLILQQYSAARQKLAQQQKVQGEEAQQGLARRQAMGGLTGGAAAKALEKTQTGLAEQYGNANADLSAAQAKALQDVQAQKEAQAYATSERVAGQEFAGSEAEKGRQYGTQERLGTQQFAGGEAEKQRAFQQEQFNKTFGLQQNQFNEAKRQFDQQMGFSLKELDENKKTNLINAAVAMDASGIGSRNDMQHVMDRLVELFSQMPRS